MKKLNVFMAMQWVVFAPIIIPISLVTGAYQGLKKMTHQAISDITYTEKSA